jgi:hypothetical protein
MSLLPLHPFQHISALQMFISTLIKKNADLVNQLTIAKTTAQKTTKLIEELINSNANSALNLLSKKIQNQIQNKNLPPACSFLSISIDWTEGFEELLQQFPSGILIQPLPEFRPESMVTIRRYSTNKELEQLFPSRLRRNFGGGGWAILEAPFELKWSKTTCKLTAKFTYTAYLSSGNK